MDGNEPDRPHKTGHPARGFWGPAIAMSTIVVMSLTASAQSPEASPPLTPQSSAATRQPAPAATPQKTEYKMSVAVGPAYPWGRGAAEWAQLVRDRTGGRIAIKVFPGASATAGDPLQEFVGLKQGSIDFAVGSAMHWAGYVKPLNVFALPFFVPDAKALDALTGGPVGAAIFKAIEDAGVVPLAWGDNEFHALSTSKQPVRKPDDVKGLRVRVTGSTPVEETFRALGATPARYRSSDAQNALLGGTLDGQETVPQPFIATKGHTLNQKHLTLWAMAAEPLVFAVSRAMWERLSPSDRDIVRQAAIDAAKKQVDASRAASAAAIASLGKEYRDAQVQVIRLTADERAAFVAATKSVHDRWAGDIGADLVRQAQDAMK